MARFDFALWIGACLVTLHKAEIGPASLAGLNISRRQALQILASVVKMQTRLRNE